MGRDREWSVLHEQTNVRGKHFCECSTVAPYNVLMTPDCSIDD